ncbi:hypothetical protein BDB00DRAFT_110680 [Zychaea mexicana]|uniref:uncharacterized protein n=1 Tax=Zychaea mexicana TaxID=64656 RepID=UPI0022FEE768|nr:uncharacterized protein BDB00DRAFT_110680 [Zychaea mexicana]KAI9484851.1 hypothetical protein BDB00DRAFT_110680 [Zychaea mexicana]
MDDPPMWGATTRSDATIWEDCTKTIIGLLEDSFEIENKGQTHKRSDVSSTRPTSMLRPGFQAAVNNSNGSLLTTKRKRSTFSDNARDRKMQRISNSLANDIARHLSMTGPENNRPAATTLTPTEHDVDMDTNNNNNNSIYNNSINKPVPPRVYKRPIRKSSVLRRFNNNSNTGYHDGFNTNFGGGQQQQQDATFLRRISGMQAATNNNQQPNRMVVAMDFDQWLKTQAQRQNLNILEYRQAFHEKQNQLQHCLTQIDTADHTKSDDQRFQNVKENLDRILKIADELRGDRSVAFADIFPEWRAFEGHINKIATYVQSIEDMKELVIQAIPRTSDLLYDIRRLQSVLESKMTLYGDNLVQNGLEWKAMGMPVDEQLIATVKGWFYNLCIGLISELDTECSKLQSLVTDMRELLHHPDGDKLMESIQNGVEFIASVISFIGLPSRKLTYGCRILATIYGQWASENLEFLRETQQVNKQGSPKSSTCTSSSSTSTSSNNSLADVKMANSTSAAATTTTTAATRSSTTTNSTANTATLSHSSTTAASSTARVEIRLMQWMDGIVQILTSLQTLQEVSLTTTQDKVSKDLEQEEERSTTTQFDSETLNVLENLASTLVEIVVRALAVIETTRSKRRNNTHTRQQGNIMMNPETSLIYMQRSVLTFVDRLMELAGREHIDGPRIQVAFSHSIIAGEDVG